MESTQRILHCLFACLSQSVCVCAADRDRPVGREALQLCSSQHGAVALVSLCGRWRAALGAGERLFSAMSQTALTQWRLSGLVYLSHSSEVNDGLQTHSGIFGAGAAQREVESSTLL